MALSLEKRLTKLANKKKAQERRRTQRKANGWLLFFSFIILVFTLLYNGRHYHFTFIPFYIPFLIWLASTISILLIKFRAYKRWLWMAMIMGNVVASLFYLINEAYADKTSQIIKQRILEKWPGGTRSGPSMKIEYNSIYKSIPADDIETMHRSNYILLTIRNGYFGYDFIEDYKSISE